MRHLIFILCFFINFKLLYSNDNLTNSKASSEILPSNLNVINQNNQWMTSPHVRKKNLTIKLQSTYAMINFRGKYY